MHTLEQAIRKARRRGIVNEAIHRGGAGAAWGIAAGFAFLMLDRLSPLAVPYLLYFALPVIGTAVGIIHAIVAHPDAFAVALRIDRSLHLKDRVATAHALLARTAGPAGSMPTHDDGFAEIVGREAEQLAGKLDIRTIAPLRLSPTWAVASGLAIALWLGYAFLPGAAWAGADDPHSPDEVAAVSPEERERDREDLRRRIEESIERYERDLLGEDDETGRDLPVDPRVREQLDALNRLAHQLSGEDADEIDLEQARDESAARLNELAEQISRDARRDREAAERLTERFAGIDPPETPMTAREFQDALRRGDFGRAADLLDERLDRKNEMAEQEREELARHLRELDEMLDERSRDDQQQLAEREAQLEQVLRDHDLDDELIRDLFEGERLTEDELERLLREESIDEELANRLARELDRLREERDLMEQMERDAEAIREALREAAEEFEQPDDPPAIEDEPRDDVADPVDEPVDEEDAPEPRDPEDPDAPADPTDPADRQPTDEETEREAAEREAAEREAAEREAAGEDAERDPDAEEKPREADDDDAPVEEREAAEEREAVEEHPSDDPDAVEEAAVDDPDAEAQEQPVADPDDPDADPDDPDAQEAAGETGPMDELPQPGEQPGAADEAADETVGEDEGEMRRSASDRLRDIVERRRRSEQQEEISEEMLERAREMLERMDPDQRQELAEQLQRQVEDAAADPSTADMPDGEAGAGGDEAGMADAPVTEGEPAERERVEIEDIDLTPDDEDYDRVLAEWLSVDELTPDPDSVQRSDVSDERMREARRVAERAVEDAAVPSRYHQFIRRYFQRLEERTESPGDE